MHGIATGLALLGRGQLWVLRRRRWLGFGLLPALITLVIYAGALVALLLNAGDLAAWATPFADNWDETWRTLLRTVVALALTGGGLALAAVTFTAVTLLIGDPFYETLSERVDDSEGGVPGGPPQLPLWRQLWHSLRDSCSLLLRMALVTVPLFVLGFVPVLGQTVIPVLGAAVSGFFLAAELTSFAMERRGVAVRERLRLLRRHLGAALGFGVPLVLLFMLPLGAVVLMPGAVAGATMLARHLTDHASTGRDAAPPQAPAAAP
ncbi:EI24 domain-containing protein [Streptomyces sp. 7-21]|uniref:EI24 domain-containing protein n=1 Tax=Streptomyces sp. 7-21 TaxID=2802283 RepID=UPI00191D85D6|nr:EI24 domain-containing protein [Streptomyces sp. 7-21]MBL1069114.1 EI24 domain-containing protein [Streptomyces sp. 7-21]